MPKRVFQNILFGADGPCRSRVTGRPTLKITKRDCGRTIRWAKLGFPTSPGECISHTHTQSGTKYKNKKLCTRVPAQEQIKDRREGGREREGDGWREVWRERRREGQN